MPNRRTATAIVVITTLLLAVAAPAGAATTTRGTAATTSVPLEITVDGLTSQLGRTALMATTDGDVTDKAPWSSVGLTLANLGGARFGDLQVTSDGTTTNQGAEVDRSLGGLGVTAEAGNLLAVADDTAGSATAALTKLTSTVGFTSDTTVLDDLGLTAEISNVVATVDDTGAGARHTLAVAGIDLTLAHLLGSILDELPLEDLLELADLLGVDAPVSLAPVRDVVTATEDLVTAVTAAIEAAQAVEDAADALAAADSLSALAALGDIDDFRALLTTLENLEPDAGPAELTAALAVVTDIINNDLNYAALSCGVGVPALDLSAVQTAIADMIACVQDHIDAYETAVAALQDELDALEDAVTAYVAALTDITAAITAGQDAASSLAVTDILDDIATLLDDLLAANVFSLTDVTASQQVRAIGSSEAASSATTTCPDVTVTAPGQDAVVITDCEGGDVLDGLGDTITTLLQNLLATVGGVDAGDGVVLEIFGANANVVTTTGDGFVRATSLLEVLRLSIPDITISACGVADGLLCALGIDLDDTLKSVLDGLAGDLSDADAQVDTALDGVKDLLALLGADQLIADVSGAAPDVTGVVTALTDALNSLLNQLDQLGTIDDTVIGGASVVIDPELEAEHQVSTASVGGPATPADPAPDSSGDDPTLPSTGGGAALLAVLALGAGAWLWRARRRED